MSILDLLILFSTIFVVSLFLLYLPKMLKFFKKFNSLSKSSVKKLKASGKLKPSSAASEFRPLVKGVDDVATKKIEFSQKDKLPDGKRKSLDFKFSASNAAENTKQKETNTNLVAKNTGEILSQKQGISQSSMNLNQQNIKPQAWKNTLSQNLSNQNVDIDEIKNFLQIPDNFEGSIPLTENKENNVIHTKTKYTKQDDSHVFPVPTQEQLNFSTEERDVLMKKSKGDNTFMIFDVDGESFDLNKLPPRLKRFVIMEILKKKQWD